MPHPEGIFELRSSDMTLDMMLTDANYNHPGVDYRIVNMSPREYFRAADRGTRSPPGHLITTAIRGMSVDDYANKMMRGIRFPVPHLHYWYGRFHQEPFLTFDGRHRALAAEKLDAAMIPVLVVYPIDPDELESVKAIMTPEIRQFIGHNKAIHRPQ